MPTGLLPEQAAALGACFVDLPKVFAESGETTDALFLNMVHPSPLGHRLIARAIQHALPTCSRTPTGSLPGNLTLPPHGADRTDRHARAPLPGRVLPRPSPRVRFPVHTHGGQVPTSDQTAADTWMAHRPEAQCSS